MPVRPITIALVLLLALALAACGGTPSGDDRAQDGTGTAGTGTAGEGGDDSAPDDPPPAESDPEGNPLDIPEQVPLEADGPADPEAERVVRAWSERLRSGDVDEAAALFATPSRAQNGTPVLTLRDRRATLAFNEALPCGAQITEAGSAGAYLVTTFRLTDRPGGACGPGAGGSARTAFRVQDGRITEFFRLPDDPAQGRDGPELPGPSPSPEPGPGPGGQPAPIV